mgnify:CR=1 FL=1
MNWLAHLRLSPPAAPLLRLGNLCGDFVQGLDLATLHPELQRGIALHRAIDRFVDGHASFRSARARLPATHRRLGGVLLDVYGDHFLARDWRHFGDGGPLVDFLAGVQRDLAAHDALLPASLRRIAPQFSPDGWLAGYGTITGIERVLTLMAARVRRPAPLATGSEPLRADYERLGADFASLWLDLEPFARAAATRACA